VSAQSAGFCTKCGSPLQAGARFCTECGAPARAGAPAASAAPAPSPTPAAPDYREAPPEPTRPHLTSIAGTARTVVSYGGTAASIGSLGWQSVVKGQPPDMAQFLARAGAPVAQQIVRRSVRIPALALILTTLLDLFVAWVTGQPSAMAAAGLRFATGMGTGLLGLIVGKRGGFFRVLVGVGSLATTALQAYNAISMLIAAIARQAPLLQLIPSLVSTAAVIFVAARMAWMTFRKVKRR
jgi:hypothetical protein